MLFNALFGHVIFWKTSPDQEGPFRKKTFFTFCSYSVFMCMCVFQQVYNLLILEMKVVVLFSLVFGRALGQQSHLVLRGLSLAYSNV